MLFAKLHGYGNDYIVCAAEDVGAQVESIADFIERICARHRGAGADGVALIGASNAAIETSDAADFSLRIFNPDGGEAAMSGNGSRCAAAYLYHTRQWNKNFLSFATRGGIKRFTRHENASDEARGVYSFTAEIGKPSFENRAVPMIINPALSEVRSYELRLDEQTQLKITALQMCNPNVCVLVDELNDETFRCGNQVLSWREVGAQLERHHQFPERTNVEFVKVVDRETLEVRVWERGAGATQSSGTGASAASVAAMINDKAARRVTVKMPGGNLQVEWRASDAEVLLTGTAEFIYQGEWLKH